MAPLQTFGVVAAVALGALNSCGVDGFVAGNGALIAAAGSTRGVARVHDCNRLHMGGAKGVASTKVGKKLKIDKISAALGKSTLVFSVPIDSVTANQMVTIRKAMPATTEMMLCKNTLFRKAAEGTQWDVLLAPDTEYLKGENMWIMVEEEYKASIDTFFDNMSEIFPKKDRVVQMQVGVMEGSIIDEAGLRAIRKLPTREELYATIASRIKAVPTNLALRIKAVPTKVGRAISLANDEIHKGEAGAEPAADVVA